MEFLRPTSAADAVAVAGERPDATAIAGGTDVMVDINFDRVRPPALLDLTGVPELRDCGTVGDRLRIGAGVTYAELIDRYRDRLPGLVMASRTVGSPQIRNRGTVGGNLGSASPAGDAHPPLLTDDAAVELVGTDGTHLVPIEEFYIGPKGNAARPGELIAAFHVPPADGPQQFAKVGTRNAMVIAVCAFAIALHPSRRTVGTGIGSAAPTPVRAGEAERFLAGELADRRCWDTGRPPGDAAIARFAELVAGATAPIDDVRGSAAYRRRALAVLAARTLRWAWADYAEGGARACA